MLANLHDIVIMLGLFAFFQWEFTLTVGAEAAIRDNLHLITLITLGAVAVIVLLYVRLKLKKKVLR